MDCPIRAESGKGRSAHIFNLNERAVAAKNEDVAVTEKAREYCAAVDKTY